MKTPGRLIRIIVLGLLLGGLISPPFPEAGEELSEYGNPFIWVTIVKTKIKAEVVASPEKQILGLGGRPELPEGRGMLFVMPSKVVQIFCMRDMHFAIDFIWLVDGRVAGITKNVSCEDQKTIYQSPEPVNFVLEVPAGFCDRHGLKVGDPASW